MTLPERRQHLAWLVLLSLTAASLAFSTYRAQGLPNLGMTLGPSEGAGVEVRTVTNPAFSETDAPKFKPGDVLTALEGNTLEILSDLRVVLQSLPRDEKLGRGEDGDGLRYQLERKEHRYTIALQPESDGRISLPPRYQPETDLLVELDGRAWRKPIGPEGVRSIVNDRDFLENRDEILLTFQRNDAVFKGTVAFEPSVLPWMVAFLFAIVFIAIAVIWRYFAEVLPSISAVAVGAETLAFGWVVMLVVNYQWLLADRTLASFAIAGLAMVRPLAIFARTKTVRGESDAPGWWALGLGVTYAALVVALLHAGLFQDIEMALYAGASATALYLVYELFVVAFDDAPQMTLQEGSGYVAGILIVGIATALFVWRFETQVFLYNLWRWFVVAFVALGWFGDALFCLRGPSSPGYGDMLTLEERRNAIREYLATVAEELPDARAKLVVAREDAAVTIAVDDSTLEIRETDETLADAISIVVRERTRIPIPETVDRSSHPLPGIAQTMNIVLALPLQPPPGGMELPQTEIVLVGIEREAAEDLPSFVSVETMELAQRRLDASTWASIFVEGVTRLSEFASSDRQKEAGEEVDSEEEHDGSDSSPSEVDPEEVRRLEASLERSEARIEMLRDDRRSLADQLQMAEMRLLRHAPPVDRYEELLEPELIETLEYLLEDDEPIAVSGPYGAGKEFTARCASFIDGQPPESFVVYEATSEREPRDALFGDQEEDGENGAEGLVEIAVGASLLVRSASRLPDSILVGLCNAAAERGFRLYLSFDVSDAEHQSPLDGRSANLVEKLEHRELIVPRLRRRGTLLPNILNFYLSEYARVRRADAERFSQDALDALRSYDFPGELREAKLIVDLAVLRSSGSAVEIEHLNAEIRTSSLREGARGEVPPDGDSE